MPISNNEYPYVEVTLKNTCVCKSITAPNFAVLQRIDGA